MFTTISLINNPKRPHPAAAHDLANKRIRIEPASTHAQHRVNLFDELYWYAARMHEIGVEMNLMNKPDHELAFYLTFDIAKALDEFPSTSARLG